MALGGGNSIDILIRATDRASQVLNNVSNASKSLGDRLKNAQTGSMIFLGGLTALAGGALALTGGLVKTGIGFKAFKQNSLVAFTTMLGSAEKAQKHLDDMMTFAKSTPFAYPDLVTSSRNLVAFGFKAKDTIPLMKTLGDVVAGIGGGNQELLNIVDIFGKMKAGGRASLEEINRLSDMGVPALAILGNQMGLTGAELREKISGGAIEANDAIKMLVDGMKNGTKGVMGETAKYGGMMDGLKGTFTGAMDSMKGAWRRAGDAMMDDALFEKLIEGVNWLTQQINKLPAVMTPVFSAINSGLNALIPMFQKAGDALSNMSSDQVAATMFIIAGAITGAVIPAFAGMAVAAWSAMAPLLPFIAVGAAVGAVAMVIYKNWSSISPVFASMWSVVQPVLQGLWKGFQQSAQLLMSWLMPAFEAFKSAITTIMPLLIAIGAALGIFLATAVAVFNGVVAAIGPILTAIGNILNVVANVVMGVIALFTGDFSGAMSYFGKAWDNLVLAIMNVFKGLVNFFAGVWNTISGIFSSFGVSIGSVVMGFVNNVLGFFKNLWNGAKSIFNNLKSGIISIVGGFISNVISKIVGFVSKIISNFVKMVTQSNQKFSSMASKVISIVTKLISSVIKFFVQLPSKIGSALASLGSKLMSVFTSAMGKGKSAVTKGISNIIGAVKGWLGKFTSSGKGLLEAFTKGIKSGITGAIGAVKKGMASIRKFLPFSPAKEGPLSDLDKSGESFFPTWYEAALKKVNPMAKAVGGAMGKVNDALNSEQSGMSLSAFSGGRTTITVVHRHEHEGSIQVNGDTGRETLELAGREVLTRTENDIFSGLRSTVRKL